MTFYSNPKRDYVLNPRGKALYDDTSRFGTKMLEKMGWSKGKGLGANLDGQLEFIKVAHKGDQKGVGFKDRDDQWTTHESNFNSLLNSFQSAENSDEQSQDCAVQGIQSDDKPAKRKSASEKEEIFSGVSLEERSKNSRARVHYKKFTRGKDLARYSEKDLANIFGKKSLKCDTETEESTARETIENEKLDKSSERTPNFGITTIETGTTINDYFKNKMKKTLNGSKKSSDEEVIGTEASVSSNKKEKKRGKKSKSSELQGPDSGDNNTGTNEETAVAEHYLEAPTINKGKKRKRDADNDEQHEEPKTIKKKKKKAIDQIVETLDSEAKLEVEALPAPKKPKKIKGEKSCDSTEDVQMEKPRKINTESNLVTECEVVNTEESQRTKKSKMSKSGDANELTRKNKSSSESIAADDSHNLDSENAQPKKKSKKNRENKQIEGCNGALSSITLDQQPNNLFEAIANLADEQDSPDVVTDNVYEIRRYRTEIFRYVDLHAFPNSTLCDIPGYGYTNEMTLKIVDKADDNRLINTLWNDAQDKYANADGKKKKKKFVEHIEDLKKKNVFKI